MDLSIEQESTAGDFLRASQEFRRLNPIETNVIGSVAESVATGARSYQECFWWIVRRDGEVEGVAIRTVPHRLLISPMSKGAARKLAEAVIAIDPGCWGVSGAEESAEEFLARWCELTDKQLKDFPQHMRETIYKLGEHTPLEGVVGLSRRAEASDVVLLLDWLKAFAKEVGVLHVEPTEVDLITRLESTPIFIWEVNGEPVAMSGHAALVADAEGYIGRIGPVYTEPSARGFGYGAAVTSAMVQHLQTVGCSIIMLYADADYEKSNRLYQKIGFRKVGTVLEFGSTPPIGET
ncbi:MAG TPA: GNAT family N-acetyltransferase [Candidatus Nanopelagicaceae bacterium]|nr:GNAT family N-acetyltransferase [Candidatus Nanopelagicaceae bacterium]